MEQTREFDGHQSKEESDHKPDTIEYQTIIVLL